ncbi:hypothetical protein QQF64_025900, partial [Cirrhinus molitorella]
SSGVNDVHVFISSGENVRLPCNNALHDCKSTTWNCNIRFRHSSSVQLITLGMKKKDTESHERLSLGSDCSLNIKNITKEDYGYYSCQQYVNGQHQGPDVRVYLHVLHVSVKCSCFSSSSSQTEISAGSSVTLYCQLYSFGGVSCDDWIRSQRIDLLWVNQAGVKLTISDSRYQILAAGHCIVTLTTTLLNEDDNREWRCKVTHRNQVKASVTYTVMKPAQDKTTTAVIPVRITNSQDHETTNTHKTKGVRRPTDDSVEQTDDVTYTEVTVNKKNQAKKNKVRCDDRVTYASIRGAEAGAQENCSQLYASVNKSHHKSNK